MARVENRGGSVRNQYRRTENRGVSAYVDGSAVRKLQTVPREEHTRKTPSTSRATKKNRERALQMNMGYVLFLTAAAVIVVFTCVNYLKLQSKSIKLGKEVTALETTLDAARLENDSDYNRIMTNIDMEHVKDVAMNKLGMIYAEKGQIVTYSQKDSDYVRQYQEVPEE